MKPRGRFKSPILTTKLNDVSFFVAPHSPLKIQIQLQSKRKRKTKTQPTDLPWHSMMRKEIGATTSLAYIFFEKTKCVSNDAERRDD